MTDKPYLFIDADDTLWENESYFREAEAKFTALLAPHSELSEIQRILWEKQEKNIPLFGYGSKTYLLGMLDAAVDICGGSLPEETYRAIRKIIEELAFHPVSVYDGVEETLEDLCTRYRLVLATKGDAIEQLFKFKLSGLEKYFYAVEVMPAKEVEDYQRLCSKFEIAASDMVMVGNSVRSDIVPVVSLGGRAIYIPHEIVWTHELAPMPKSEKIIEISNIFELKTCNWSKN